MGLRFKRSIKIFPGVRINLSGSGVGISVGPKGFKVGVDAKGRSYTHVSVPGTGLYSRSYSSSKDDKLMRKRDHPVGNSVGDPLFKEAVATVVAYDRASPSLLQRRLSIGYARAARLLDELEARGVLGPQEGSKPREVLKK